MKLRLQRPGGEGGSSGGARLMLSPGDGAWCRVDAGSAALQDGVGASVVLTGMQREQVGGLLDLRDGAPIDLYATPAVFEHLTQALPLLPVLQQFCGVQWHLIPVAGEQHSASFAIDGLPTLGFTAITAGRAAPGERIALAVRDERSGARLFVVDGASFESAAFDTLFDWMMDADCVVIDRAPHGVGTRWFEQLARVPRARKVLLDANGHDRALFSACGIECADRAIEFEL
jgi:pyrroloquinoline quinone biosynthesis protein B